MEVRVGADNWPWPRVTDITAPEVPAKQIRVLIGGGTDGTYRIQIDANTEHSYAATSKTAAEIAAALLALIDDAEVTADVDPENDDAILITGATVGTDFTVTVASTGSAMTKTTIAENVQPAAGLHVHAFIDRPAP